MRFTVFVFVRIGVEILVAVSRNFAQGNGRSTELFVAFFVALGKFFLHFLSQFLHFCFILGAFLLFHLSHYSDFIAFFYSVLKNHISNRFFKRCYHALNSFFFNGHSLLAICLSLQPIQTFFIFFDLFQFGSSFLLLIVLSLQLLLLDQSLEFHFPG